MKKNKRSLFITSGDPDGIGFEVATKALCDLPTTFFKTNTVFLFGTIRARKKYLDQLRKCFHLIVFWTSSDKFSHQKIVFPNLEKKPVLFLVIAQDSPADWIFNLAKLCMTDSRNTALVTGPLSKTLIRTSGYKAIGHTEILAQVSKAKLLYMGFVGKYFNVVLLTGHIPLSHVSKTLKKVNWPHVVHTINDFRHRLRLKNRPVAVLGVNPHAGENGMISSGEERYLTRKLKRFGDALVGPLVPDAAFLKNQWSRYSVYLCCYHDQGLIPFKTVHGQDSGVHITLGLPFVRTSVDHGTAKEIFHKNVANPNSMREAIELAARLLSASV